MAGDIFYVVTLARAKELKKKPESVWKFERNEVRHVDLRDKGYPIDVALDRLAEQLGEPALSKAVIGGDEIGNGDVSLKQVSARDVKSIARAIARVEKEMFNEALCAVFGSCDDDQETDCWPAFEDLKDFYCDAAKAGGAVVKTIY